VNKLNPLQKYKNFCVLLGLPRVNSIEQAEDQIAVEEGDTIRFLLIEQQGFYKVCSAYLSTNREGATSWQHRHEFSFAHFDIVKAKNEAALTIGLELIESMGDE
jgi:hypothetical protein